MLKPKKKLLIFNNRKLVAQMLKKLFIRKVSGYSSYFYG